MRIRHLRIEKAAALGVAGGEYYEEQYEKAAIEQSLNICDVNPDYESRITKYLKYAFQNVEFVPRSFKDIQKYATSSHDKVYDKKAGRNLITFVKATKSMIILLRGGEVRISRGVGLSADHTYSICPVFHGNTISARKGYNGADADP